MGIAEIKNCPFCGSEFEVYQDIEEIVISHILHDGCPLSGIWQVYERDLYSESDILDIWNMRT